MVTISANKDVNTQCFAIAIAKIYNLFMSEATAIRNFEIGKHVANLLEAVKEKVDGDYRAQNWDIELGYNIYEGKTPSEMVDEYVNSGAGEPQLSQLVEGLNNSYPDEKNRPEFVKDTLKQIESKLNPEV